MKITVIGTGNMGSAFVKQLTNAGHSVRVTGRDMVRRHWPRNIRAPRPSLQPIRRATAT